MRPRFTDAESAGVGLGMDAIAMMLAGRFWRSNSKPGANEPLIGTDACGLPRGGTESLPVGDSHGSTLGCWRKSVNHEQPASPTTANNAAVRAERRARRLALTSHLLGPMLLQNLHRVARAVGIGDDPDAEVARAESRVVPDGRREPWNVREREHRERGGQTADEHHQLEPNDRERHPARHRLAADDD